MPLNRCRTPRIQDFQHNEVYVALTATEIPGLLHWLIYVVNDTESGWKVHASSKDSDVFYCAKEEWRYVDDDIAVAFIKVGQIDEGLNVDHLVDYVKGVQMNVVPESQLDDETKFSCRVFVKEAIRILNEAGVFVKCPDFKALAREVNERAIDVVEHQNPQLPLLLNSKTASSWQVSSTKE
ncbi:hypothetical protein NP233_g12178 [Leucocoprinus birnbaumii]|uniref:Uncharacterized protein n=1 Tax=Leucocoprinus birnbaumii TaxID=56174 RepID=A0AAD5YJP3_9AGAR|nr:hypothetical protein NP233_g12178 [Leucocoprinus birnbaumii]